MGGVITGSEIVTREHEAGSTLGVTVNDYCNLRCTHCYLPRDRDKDIKVIPDDLIKLYGDAEYQRMVVVGMEPFADLKTREATFKLLTVAGKKGSKLGVLTNGINLSETDATRLKELGVRYVDISMDGGSKTYQEIRRASFDKVKAGIDNALQAGLTVNILHTLFTQNCTPSRIEDMLAVRKIMGGKGLILFSPYIPVADREAREAGLPAILSTLKATSFVNTLDTFLMLDPLNTSVWGGIDSLAIKQLVQAHRLEERVHLTSMESTHRVLRVTWDGFAVHPLDSVQVLNYNAKGIKLNSSSDLKKIQDQLIEQSNS